MIDAGVFRQSKRSRGSGGFTIIELLIALSVFSVILLMTSGVIIELSRQFYKGMVRYRTQEVARRVSEEISSNIQFSTTPPISIYDSASVKVWCIADRKYTVVLGQAVPDSVPNALIRGDDCGGTFDPADPSQLIAQGSEVELLSDNMRVSHFDITTDSSGRFWSIVVTVAHGDDDSMNNPNSENPTCRPEAANSTYCAVVTHRTSIVRKL